jgi:amino acid transporter
MLTFITVWRAAALVLSDLASSAYYAGGVAENSVGKAAPWFILGIMLFGFAIRAIYLESSSMFVRGGVYKVVREALGGTLAKLSVSALMFDYILTGPISGVSAGLYLSGLLNDTAGYLHQPWRVPPPHFAVGFALIATAYFWIQNTFGIRESSEKALRIMQVTTVMVVILIVWCLVTAWKFGYQPVPPPIQENLRFGPHALGWLKGTALPGITAIAVLIGLGHSLLAMSGFETMAQVYREIEAPKLRNLQRASLVVITYALLFTGSVSFFAVMLIPDAQRLKYVDNLIGGLAMFLAGPAKVRLAFHGFVVLVGTLILAGAVNTSLVGSNGVLNRVAEDGVLPEWFRQPHRKYGTTSRILNLTAILQVVTILLSRGNINLLGEAYAFGVIWSFAMKACGVLVLRYKRPVTRAWKVPLNFRVAGTEIPVGLSLITAALFSLAMINVLTKKTATISGSIFTLTFFLVFSFAERRNVARTQQRQAVCDRFRLEERSDISFEELHVRPGNVLVEVEYPDSLEHLEHVLRETDPVRQDVVVLIVHKFSAAAAGEHALEPLQICSGRETDLLSKVVEASEKIGKPVALLVALARDPYCAAVFTAQKLRSVRIVLAHYPHLKPEEQSRELGRAWEELPEPHPIVTVEIVSKGEDRPTTFALGPHVPQLRAADIELIHRLWRELTEKYGIGPQLHHRDVVSIALRHLDRELHSSNETAVLDEVRREIPPEQLPRPTA